MTQTETIKCDGCGKTVIGNTKGWIRIKGNEDCSINVLVGSDTFAIIADEQIDFCSAECVCKWIKKVMEKAGIP